MSRLHTQRRLDTQRILRLKARLKAAIDRRGVKVDAALHEDLRGIIREHAPSVRDQYPPGSFPRIFWDQQERACGLHNAKSMKWEPAMIRFV